METFRGRVRHGVVVLEGNAVLPEGAVVLVSQLATTQPTPASEKKRIQVPLVRTGQPDTLHLTNERIAMVLDDEDAFPPQ